MPVYVALAKLHVSKVIPPIKKTNLILKNVNFQYAMKLWDFLQSYRDDDTLIVRDKKNIDNDLKVKQLLDDSFLLSYLRNEYCKQKKKSTIRRLKLTLNLDNLIKLKKSSLDLQ